MININGLGLPNCSDIVDSWASDYVGFIIKKEIVNFILQETKTRIKFKGIIQNNNSQDLQITPEGQRNWKKYKLHTTKHFNNDDIIEVKGTRYRLIRTRNDDTYYGFWAYDMIEDYVNSTEYNNANIN